MGSTSSLQRSRERSRALSPPPVPGRNAPPSRVQVSHRPVGAVGPGGPSHVVQPPHYLMFSGPPTPYRFNNGGGPHIFYVDSHRQTIPPPAVKESAKVRNHANLLKHSLRLVPAEEPLTYCVVFQCDTAVPTRVQIFFGATEWPDLSIPDNPGLFFAAEGPPPRCALPVQEIPACTDFHYASASETPLDLRDDYASPLALTYSPDRPHSYPIIIVLSYQVPKAEEYVGTDPESPAVPPSPTASDINSTPAPAGMQAQYTYAEVYYSADEAIHKLRCIRQRLQLADGSVFELEDIYGVTSEDHQPAGAVGTAVIGAAVTPADELSLEGDECVICLATERDTTVMPCRHMCLCGECAEVLRRQTNKCPICRTVIECLMTLKKD